MSHSENLKRYYLCRQQKKGGKDVNSFANAILSQKLIETSWCDGMEVRVEEKLERLYFLYEQKMYRIAYSIVHDVEQAEDIVQESFLKIFTRLEKIQDVHSIETKHWILRIVKNEAIDHYRKNKKRYELFRSVTDDSDSVEYSNHTSDEIQQMMEEEYIQDILEKLPEKYKEILQFRIFYELSTEETAKILGIREDAVRKRYARAKEQVRHLIDRRK